jgi:hypothetical protein
MPKEYCFQCGHTLVPVADNQPSECPSCCQLCGEPADGESTEYYDQQLQVSLPGHYQCIVDHGYNPA